MCPAQVRRRQYRKIGLGWAVRKCDLFFLNAPYIFHLFRGALIEDPMRKCIKCAKHIKSVSYFTHFIQSFVHSLSMNSLIFCLNWSPPLLCNCYTPSRQFFFLRVNHFFSFSFFKAQSSIAPKSTWFKNIACFLWCAMALGMRTRWWFVFSAKAPLGPSRPVMEVGA